MGVDARMVFTMSGEPKAERLRQIQYCLMEKVGKELFWCDTYQNPSTGKHENDRKFPQPFLVPVGTYEQDGPDLILPNAVKVKLFCRYYGDGYERGPALNLIAVMLTLLGLPDVTAVYYGGDSSGICAEPFTREKVLALLDHFCRVGHEPYHSYFDRGERQGESPRCSYCGVPLLRNGWGQRFAVFYCQGCGETLTLRDEDFDNWKNGTMDVRQFPRFGGVAQPEASHV